MLRDQYDPTNLFDFVPVPGLELHDQLSQLDELLDDDFLVGQVRSNLLRRHPKTATLGRHSTPVEVILRMLVVKRLYGWSYEQTEYFVSDSLVLRQFCRVYFESVPDDTNLIRWANLIGPETIRQLNERVVELARKLKVTRGRKLRVDSTAIEANIHHPMDSGLLADGVKVLSRLLKRAKTVSVEGAHLGKAVFRSHTRTVRRLIRQLRRGAGRRSEEAAQEVKTIYARLIHVVETSQQQAMLVREDLLQRADKTAGRLVEGFDHFLPLISQVVLQTTKRVIEERPVPSREKLLSLFEPYAQVVMRYRVDKMVEFGRRLWLEEVEGGIVSGYRFVEGGGQDYAYLKQTLADHKRRFGKPPDLLTGDRGVYTPSNEALAAREGVKRVAIPMSGKAPPERLKRERESWFRRGYRFRAGIEGRISLLRRRYGLKRCLDHGEDGMGRWVGWGILAHNLSKIAETVVGRQAFQKKIAA